MVVLVVASTAAGVLTLEVAASTAVIMEVVTTAALAEV